MQRGGKAVTKIAMRFLPGSCSNIVYNTILTNRCTREVQQDPTFNSLEYLHAFGYDNIQVIKYARSTEAQAGKSKEEKQKKKGINKVRTMRIVLSFHYPSYAKLQRCFTHNPRYMCKLYPLHKVPLNCIEMSSVRDANNPDNRSDLEYLDAEIFHGYVLALQAVIQDMEIGGRMISVDQHLWLSSKNNEKRVYRFEKNATSVEKLEFTIALDVAGSVELLYELSFSRISMRVE